MNWSGFAGYARRAGAGIRANPAVFTGAALAAPFSIYNDERGYFGSAMLSTPLLAAAFAAFPHPVGSADALLTRADRFFAQANSVLDTRWDFHELAHGAATGRDLSSIPGLRQFLDTAAIRELAGSAQSWDQDAAWTNVTGMFENLIGAQETRSLLTHAVEQARLASLSPAEIRDLGGVDSLPAVLANRPSGELRKTLQQYKSRPDFVRSLEYRLDRIGRLTDHADLELSHLSVARAPVAMDMTDDVLALLETQRSPVAEALRRKHLDLSHVQAVVDQGANGAINHIRGLLVTRGDQTLAIPLFDPATHSALIGQDFGQPGIARFLYTDKAVYDPDVFLVNNLGREWGALEQDLGAAFYYGSVDPNNAAKRAARAESAEAELASHAVLMRGRQAVPTSLADFAGSAYDSRDFGFAQRAELIKRMMTDGLPHNGDGRNILFGAYGSDSSTTHGILGVEDLRFHNVGANPEMTRQTPAFRAFSKEMEIRQVGDPFKPLVTTEAMAGRNEVRALSAGVSPRVKSLLGDLAWEASHGGIGLAGIDQAARVIRDETGLPLDQATARANDLAQKLDASELIAAGRQLGAPEEELLRLEQESHHSRRAAAALGSLGEGGALLHPDFATYEFGTTKSFTLNTVKIKVGEEFSNHDVLGIFERNPVTSKAPRNIVRSIEPLDGHQFRVDVEQIYPVESGAKGELAAVKGIMTLQDSELEFEGAKGLLNEFFGYHLGSDVDAITPLHYGNAKAQDLFRHLLLQGVDTAYRLDQDDPLAAGYLRDLEANQFQRVGHQYQDVIEHEVAGLSKVERDARIARRNEALVTATENFLNRVGEGARANAAGYGDELFQHFRESGLSDFIQFRHQNAFATSVNFWGSNYRNLPSQTAVTFDLIGEMWRTGHIEGLKDIYSRMTHPGGDPAMGWAFFDHLITPAAGPLGKVLPADALIRGEGVRDRVNTIFDPAHPDMQANFSIDLGRKYAFEVDGHRIEIGHLPVLGKEAYRGLGDQYDPGTFRADDYERALEKVKNAVSAGDEGRIKEALSAYYQTGVQLQTGKEGALRARGIVAGGGAGFQHTRPHPDNPFTLSISRDAVERLKGVDDAAHKTLLGGGLQPATMWRHPISNAPYVNLVMDETLGRNEVGFDEALRGIHYADDDQDTLYYVTHHGDAAREAREEMAVINRATSAQWRRLDKFDLLYGSGEDSRSVARSTVDDMFTGKKSLVARVRDSLAGDRVKQVTNRLGGATIGMHTNLLDRIMLNLQAHPTLSLNADAREMLELSFWQIRQTPIAAAKSDVLGDNPLRIYHRVQDALKSPALTDPDALGNAMHELAGVVGKERAVTPEVLELFPDLKSRVRTGQQANVLQELVGSEKMRGWFREFAKNRNPEADHLARMLSAKDLTFSQAMIAARNMGHTGPALQAAVKAEAGSAHAAGLLGGINEAWRSATSGARESFAAAKPALALGLGVATLAGLMTATVTDDDSIRATAPPPPVRRPRPGAAGATTDSVPDEPIAGSEAPSNPKRLETPADAGVRTAVVAPVNRARRLEVKATAPNRSSLREMERTLEASAGRGHVSVTKNYSRPLGSTLRQRERIKEQLDY